MPHFVSCENAACHFVVDISNQERQDTRRQSILSACPECGSNLSSTCPFSGRILLVRWPGGLPHCACCPSQASTRSERAHAATRPHTIANAAKHR